MLEKKVKKRIIDAIGVFLLAMALVGYLYLRMGSHSERQTSGNGEQTYVHNKPVKNLIMDCAPDKPLIFSHRGDPYNAPEHSFKGYDSAIQQGTEFIEQDVWLSKDGSLFVSHDNNLFRTTGFNINITDSTTEQLSKVRLRNGEQLHSLEAVFSRYGRKIHYVIEAKNDSTQNDLATQHTMLSVIEQYDMKDNVIIQDTRIDGLSYIHQHQGSTHIPTLWLLPGTTVSQRQHYVNIAPHWITFISLDLLTVTKQDIANIKVHHFLSNLWTITEYSDIQLAKSFRPDSIFTNETKRTINALD